MHTDPTAAPAYGIVQDKIKEISKDVVIKEWAFDTKHMSYRFLLSNDATARQCEIMLNRALLDDLSDYTGTKTSSFWQDMQSKLTSELMPSIHKAGLIPYTREHLKQLIFEHAKQQLEHMPQINKLDLIGKSYQLGSLEDFLGVKLTPDERDQAATAFDELRAQTVLIPTHQDPIHPDHWVKLGQPAAPIQSRRLTVFVSYSTKDKVAAGTIKAVLDRFAVNSFLAHENIDVSEDWKKHITEELNRADIFVALLSDNFKNSDWAPQEVGAVYMRNILIIPLAIDDTVPFGFIRHLQGRKVPANDIPLTLLIKPIADKFPTQTIPAIIRELERAGSFRYAESVMELLVPHFQNLEQDDINKLAEVSIANGQIWSAAKCRDEYLPQFIAANRSRIPSDKLKALSYQIETQGREAMSTTGEKPGKGTYTCTKCGQSVTLDDSTDTLPPCPKCNNTEFTP